MASKEIAGDTVIWNADTLAVTNRAIADTIHEWTLFYGDIKVATTKVEAKAYHSVWEIFTWVRTVIYNRNERAKIKTAKARKQLQSCEKEEVLFKLCKSEIEKIT